MSKIYLDNLYYVLLMFVEGGGQWRMTCERTRATEGSNSLLNRELSGKIAVANPKPLKTRVFRVREARNREFYRQIGDTKSFRVDLPPEPAQPCHPEMTIAADTQLDQPRPRRRDAEATRKAILEAAKIHFARSGYDGAYLRDIAVDAGVDAALINRYFGGKEGLFAELLKGDRKSVV